MWFGSLRPWCLLVSSVLVWLAVVPGECSGTASLVWGVCLFVHVCLCVCVWFEEFIFVYLAG